MTVWNLDSPKIEITLMFVHVDAMHAYLSYSTYVYSYLTTNLEFLCLKETNFDLPGFRCQH